MSLNSSLSLPAEMPAGTPSSGFASEQNGPGFYLGTTRYECLADAASRLRVPRPVLRRLVEVDSLSGIPLLEAVFRWKRGQAVAPSTQSPQRRGTPVVINGVAYPSLAAACAGVGISEQALYYRVHVLGWTPEEALTMPIGQRRESRRGKKGAPRTPVQVSVEGKTFKSISEAARHYDKSPTRVQARLRYGWSLEMALSDATNLSVGEMFRVPVEYMGEKFPSVFKACKALGVPYAPVLSQMSFGKPFEVALGLVAETLRIQPTPVDAKKAGRKKKAAA